MPVGQRRRSDGTPDPQIAPEQPELTVVPEAQFEKPQGPEDPDRAQAEFGGRQIQQRRSPGGGLFKSLPQLSPPTFGDTVMEKVIGAAEGPAQLITGIGRGIVKDPINRKVIELTLGDDVDELMLDAMTDDVSGAGTVGEFVGKWGTMIYGATKYYQAGRFAARKGLEEVGKRGLGGKTGKEIAERLSDDAVSAAKRLEALGAGGLKKSKLERGAEAVGGAVGAGLFEGTRKLAEGETLEDAGRAAVIAGAFTLGFEGLVVGAGLGLAKAKTEIKQVLDDGALADLGSRKEGAENKLEEMAAAWAKTFHSNSQKIELAKRNVETADVRQGGILARIATEQRRIAAKPQTAGLPPDKFDQRLFDELQGNITFKQRNVKELAKQQKREKALLNDSLPNHQQELIKKQREIETFEQWMQQDTYLATRGKPFNPTGWRLTAHQLGANVFTTAEGLRGKLGGLGNKLVLDPISEADRIASVALAKTNVLTTQWVGRSAKNLGISKKQLKKDDRAFLQIAHAWETEGDDGVRFAMANLGRSVKQAEDQVAIFGEIRLNMREIADGLEGLGAQAVMSAEQMGQLGVKEFLPHLLANLPEAEIRKRLAKRYGEPAAERMWLELNKTGLSKFGSFDWNRTRKGSLQDKINDKFGDVYETNFFSNVHAYLSQGHRRFEYGRRFGLDGALRDDVVQAVRAQSGEGAGAISAAIIDTAMGQDYFSQHLRQLARIATSGQITSKLGLAVIPNMSQTANSAIFGNFRNLQKGARFAMSKENKEHVQAVLAIFDETSTIMGQAGQTAKVGATRAGQQPGAKVADTLEAMASGTLRYSGFTVTESTNKILGAGTGRAVFRDILFGMDAGRLRGTNWDAGLRQMDALGFSPGDTKRIIEKMRVEGPEWLDTGEFIALEARAMYKAAQVTQFLPGTLRRPQLWTHPLGRVASQFKSFALNHSRFMKDQVWAEAVAGNLRPMAYTASIYPIAGEIVGDLKSIARLKDRDKHGLGRVVDNMTMLGGMGLFGDVFTAASWGRVPEFFAGPTATDAAGYFSSLATGDVGGVAKRFWNQPTMQGVKFLTVASAATAKLTYDAVRNAIDPEPEATDFFHQLNKNK